MNRTLLTVLVLSLFVSGCEGRNVDLVEQEKDAATLADASPDAPPDALPDTSIQEEDAQLDCGPDMMLYTVYTQPGCDAAPEKICVGMMAGDRHIKYCTCDDPHVSNDLGWEQGGIAPWFGKGYGLYTEPGCDGSVLPTCREEPWPAGSPPATYCHCDGITREWTEQGSHWPYIARGACDAGTD